MILQRIKRIAGRVLLDDGAANARKTRISSGGGELARLALTAALAVAATSAAAPATAVGPPVLVPARAQDLCVTEGEVAALGASALTVGSPKMRAFLNRATGQSIEARFKYLGGTAHESPLGSGTDACNGRV